MTQDNKVSTTVPGVDMKEVIPSYPYTVYEGCSKPGQVPVIIKIIEKVKQWLKRQR